MMIIFMIMITIAVITINIIPIRFAKITALQEINHVGLWARHPFQSLLLKEILGEADYP